MPYSITTKDGITISNIPDDLPHDAPELKQRVATLRAQSGQGGGIPMPTATEQAAPAPPVTAPKSGYLMGLRDPIDAGAQLLEHLLPAGVSSAINSANNWLADKTGLVSKVAEGPDGTSKMVQAVNKAYDEGRTQRAQGLSNLITGEKADPGFDWMRLAGNVINPVTLLTPTGGAGVGASIGALARAGAVGGAVSGLEQPVLNDNNGADFWAKKAEQGALGAVSGGVATPLVSKGVGAVVNGAQRAIGAVQQRVAPAAMTPGSVQQAVADALSANGMRLEDAPPVILQSVTRQAQEALQAGQKLDPVAAIRKAQFEAVGMTGNAAPTLGQVTRDPMQYANERNLVGVRIKTPTGEGNPLSDRFQSQANAMQGVFDRAGATGATDSNAAGATLMDALRTADAPVKGAVDAQYAAARAMNNGRAAELERGTFSNAANQSLDEGMLGHALPGDVRNLLNDITSGKTPFNVDAATQIDSILSRAQRKASIAGDDNAALAVGKVRDALHATPLVTEGQGAATAAGNGVQDAIMPGAPQLGGPAVDRSLPVPSSGNQVGQVLPNAGAPAAPAAQAGIEDTGANARAAFDQARRAARNRFATIEDTPALKAALDDAEPDKFVQKFVLNAPARDVASMRTVLQNSPEALQQARAQIANTLKRAAFGNNASGDGGFAAERYMNTLTNLGREKLSVFFTPEELVQFNLAGKVMSDITSIPAGAKGAVNMSGTSGAIMNLFSKIAESPTLRRIPVVRNVANAVGEIPTERAMNKALAAQAVAAKPGAELSPAAASAIRLLFAPTMPLAGALGGQAAQ